MGSIRRFGARRFLIGGVAVFVLVAASAALAVASGWKVQRTPNPPAQEGSSLAGVSCSSGSACTAVGFSVTDNVHLFLTLAERWNGHGWSIQPTPNPVGTRGGENYLFAVSCSSSSACTAVGNYLTRNGNKALTLAERWNGHSWRIQPTANVTGASGNDLNGVSCWSASGCIAVGSSNGAQPLAESWNGHSWRIQRTPNPSRRAVTVLSGVSCLSASACTAVGSYTIGTKTLTLAERWNGTRWSIQHTPNPPSPQGSQSVLSRVSCSSGSACTAVGYFQNSGATQSTPLAERWDGTSWSILHTLNPPGAQSSILTDVSCSSASACTAVGVIFIPIKSKSSTFAERWNGTSWSIQHTPNPARGPGSINELDGVSCSSGIVCTAVGAYGTSKALTLAERWHGG